MILVLAAAAGITACTTRPAAVPPAETTDRPLPSVGDTVGVPSGDITLVATNRNPPVDWNGSPVTETLWLSFEFRNTSETTVTIRGFRGAPDAVVHGADGMDISTTAKTTRYTQGTGGWGLGQPEAVTLDPGGVLYATLGVALTEEQYDPGATAASVTWKPIGEPGVTFVLP